MRRILFLLIVVVTVNPFVSTAKNLGKFHVELSGGISQFDQNSDLFLRDAAMVQQHEWNLDNSGFLSSSIEQNLEKIKRLIPLRLTMGYELNNGWQLIAGLEWSRGTFSSSVQSVGYRETFSEHAADELDYTLSYVMPFIGIEKQVAFVSIYSAVGWNAARLKFTQDYSFAVNGSPTPLYKESINASGGGVGILLGVKYLLKIHKQFGFHIKLEGLMAKIPSLHGDYLREGPTTSRRNGYIYTYTAQTIGARSWDLFDESDIATLAEGSSIQNPSKMSIGLSSLRLIVGISF